MCGIAGCVKFDTGDRVASSLIQAMTDALAHRGPDGEGFFVRGPVALGHRRLSIIDLTGGAQPLSNESGSLWLICNGEIYNHVELRRELAGRHHFRTQSDSEVILHLYEEYGADCVEHLNGMFAFAIWDAREKTLFLARDRLGIKPLYWTKTGDALLFASEIKALFASRDVVPRMNREALPEYLTFQFLLGDATLFEGVHRLEPGTHLTIRPFGDARVRVERYWEFDYELDRDSAYEDHVARVSMLLRDSVALQLRSDVPVGAYLSGGLDSSVVATLAARQRLGSLPVFTGAFDDGPGYDESPHARRVADGCGATYHEIRPDADGFCRDMPTLAWLMDEPAAGPGLYPQFHVSRLASQHVKVCLGGQGGDELFGGYARYLAAYLEQCLKGAIHGTQDGAEYVVTWDEIAPNLPLLKEYTALLQGFWSKGLFDDMPLRYLALVDRSAGLDRVMSPDVWNDAARQSVVERFRSHFEAPSASSYFVRMTHFDLKSLLPALLHVEDRVSMGASLETRVPLLDHRVVETVTRMPPIMRFRGACSKRVLRRVAKGVVPQAVLDRRDKMGFPVPFDEWFAREPVRSFVRDALLGATARSRGLWDVDRLEREMAASGRFNRKLWGLLNLELWLRQFEGVSVPFARPAGVGRNATGVAANNSAAAYRARAS
ncbi:MAG: asparagine synthase (glutamine-hydrolyzing) [Phycisphaerales bacterium]|nr:asparagine synthase (glutamine-hydrolyzing) [Phycisphaerales bacterium]MCB9863113.1 asparagine synthase (glutamine-hydrolyzing) [Phycisphaerales bacterium]